MVYQMVLGLPTRKMLKLTLVLVQQSIPAKNSYIGEDYSQFNLGDNLPTDAVINSVVIDYSVEVSSNAANFYTNITDIVSGTNGTRNSFALSVGGGCPAGKTHPEELDIMLLRKDPGHEAIS